MCGLNTPSPADAADDTSKRRRNLNAETRREIAAIVPTMPPAMAPAFELWPLTGTGVAVFEAAVFEVELPETDSEVPEGPSIVPGPRSWESIEVRHQCETVTGLGRRNRGENPHHRWHTIG